jgi:hypothetical protein
MGDSPFKNEEEPLQVFQEQPTKQNTQKTSNKKPEPVKEAYAQFPEWDLFPPFQVVKRGGKK